MNTMIFFMSNHCLVVIRAEEYLVNSVALSHLSEDPQHRTAKYVSQQSSAASPTTPTSPTNSSSATANTNASVNGAYVKTLQHFMNKNLYFKRLFLPHRYVAMLQVDIYGLKQVTQLRASLHNNSNTQSNAAAAAARRPSILSCGDPSNATLTPSLTVHTSAIECYAVIRLVKDYTGSASSGFTGTDCILSATNPLQYNAYLHGSRVYPEGSFITASKRLDPHMNSSNNAAKKFEQAAAASQYGNSAGYQSKAILAQISQSLDYDWRTQSIFRFALPEGWISLLQEHHHHHHHRSHAQHPCQRIRTPPPIKITISVFEKSFFGDTKIGDMELNLTDFSDKK